MSDLVIDGRPLDVSTVVRFGFGNEHLVLSHEVREVIARGREVVDEASKRGTPVYGLTTALGSKVSTRIDPTSSASRERDVVTGRMVGLGDPYPIEVARSAMLLRLHGLGKGAAGVSPHVVEHLTQVLNAGIVVRAPRSGTIGASDLGPGAALAGALLGVGSVWDNGEVVDAHDALRRHGLSRISLGSKDALGIINSSVFSLAHGVHVVAKCRGVLAASAVVAVAHADAFGVNPRVYLPDVHALRPLPHAVPLASMLSQLIEGSWVVDGVTDPQQALSFRTLVPQFASVVGAVERFSDAVVREINGVGDNPVALIERGEMVSSSHFHTIDLALHGDALSLALFHWADSCVQRMQRTINHRITALPPLLAHGDSASTGLNPLQKTIAQLRGQMRHQANPASLDVLVVSDQVEDVASHLPLVVDKLAAQVEVLGRLMVAEALVTLQCLALREPIRKGPAATALRDFYADVQVPFADSVPIGRELERMYERRDGWIARALRDVGNLWPTSPLVAP